jgi:NAD+ synthase (glutamine-hydrolysing)
LSLFVNHVESGLMENNKIKISLAQINPRLGDISYNLEKHLEFIKQAKSEQADVILFPELSLTGYSLKDAVYDVAVSADNEILKPLYQASNDISICFGLVELTDTMEAKNSNFFLEDGQLCARHRKVYLPTYGVFEEKRYFTSGNRFRAFDSRHGRFGILICEDMWHSSSTMILAQDGALAIFVSSAGVLRGVQGQTKPENVQVWENLNRTSAHICTSYFIFCNRVGVEDGLRFWGGSEIIDPHGKQVVKAPYFKEHLVTAEIDWLKLKHARIHATLLSDERLDIVTEELDRIAKAAKEY